MFKLIDRNPQIDRALNPTVAKKASCVLKFKKSSSVLSKLLKRPQHPSTSMVGDEGVSGGGVAIVTKTLACNIFLYSSSPMGRQEPRRYGFVAAYKTTSETLNGF
uniref:Uncharacterized protein n=1 Tax=Glossina pallidipes TaxID=7398 RepID=A0A1A9ZEF5_GLOPL